MNSRRQLIATLATLLMAPWPAVRARPDDAAQAISKIVGSRLVQYGRIHIELAPLVENGNSVTAKFSAQSPMTAADYVRSMFVISEGNPLAEVVSSHFSPLSGRAQVTTRIRLAESQRIWVIAEMSDGSLWRAHADTVVTLSACTEMI